MIEKLNEQYNKKYLVVLTSTIVLAIVTFVLSLMIGQYGLMSLSDLTHVLLNDFGGKNTVSGSYANVINYIRLPRAIAAFLVGGSLSISGVVYQNTFNNKLISPDILGVSAGACVGAGIAILMGLNATWISMVAFIVGFASVVLALLLPKLFRNTSNIALVLSGIIVGAFMNSIIGLLKYMADGEEKLAAITYWIMGSITGISLKEIVFVLPMIIVPTIVLILMSHRIDVISLGQDEASSLGINFQRNRLLIIICSTMLTAASVSISGNVGWVGLVIPHISRSIVGNRAKAVLPLSFLSGGTFMMIVDTLSRNLAKDDIPLSIITGIFGAVIYSAVLIKRGQAINE